MKVIQFIKMSVFASVLLSSCKRDDDINLNPDNPNNITLLNSNQWTVVANHIQKKQQGGFGWKFRYRSIQFTKAG